ncbi:hypothetical protein K9N08_01835 [Candidatus Gracilibacteria bacterium]|nr:hypothetical protein [Candidatus Gracilibacteria bacterium]MCF7856278.1 hypothetical protein [Candidatus Gracilibacteria bacterium]MCF7896243.1 hypothetical protein [Candidatus Gracilibacteria bacterium]
MSNLSKIALIKEMLDSAESSLRSAKQLLAEFTGSGDSGNIRSNLGRSASKLNSTVDEAGKIIEGVFDGKSMIGPDQREYPIPANYASKSKLIPGDVMKLTVAGDGGFTYKQIGPVERKRVVGPLTSEDGQYKVIAAGKAYKVLLASVTFYRAEPGDEVVLLVPAVGDSEWGAIDNVIPRIQAEVEAEEKIISESKKAANSFDPDEDEGESFTISDEPEKPKKRAAKNKKED